MGRRAQAAALAWGACALLGVALLPGVAASSRIASSDRGTARAGLAPKRAAHRSPATMVGTELEQEEIERTIAAARARRFKPVGTTSVVYQVLLEAGIDAAFKPATVERPGGHHAEIAAYRLSRALAMDNVPPAVTRRVDADELRDRLHPAFEDLWPEIVRATLWDPDGKVTGAAIYWVPELRNLGLERTRAMERWARRLAQGSSVPPGQEPLHADLSSLVCLDYLIGNWDRWSGGNVQGLPDGRRLVVRDHDAAFAVPLAPQVHARVLTLARATERFSRTFVEALLHLDAGRLRAELLRDPGAERRLALDERQIRDVMARRATLLSHIASLVEEHGERAVLTFE